MTHQTTKLTIMAVVVATACTGLGQAVEIETTTQPTTQSLPPTTRPVSEAEIQTLIGQLDNDDPAVVAGAREKLLLIGEQVKPALLRRLREQTAAADLLAMLASASYLAPTKISLHLTNATPTEAIDALAKEIGVSLKPRKKTLLNNEKGKITCDFDQQPFWTVIKDLCAQGNLMVNSASGDGQFSLTSITNSEMKNPITSLPVSDQGSILVALKDFGVGGLDEAKPSKRVGTIPTGTVEIWCEPKLRPLRVSAVARVDEAIDDQGQSLIAGDPVQPMEYRPRYSVRLPVRTNFTLNGSVNNKSKRIKTLRGKVGLMLVADEQKIDLADVLTGKEVVKTMPNGKTYTFSGFKRLQNRYTLMVESDGEFPILLVAADSEGATFTQSGQLSGRRASVHFALDADDLKNPNRTVTKLTWIYISKSVEVQVPFEFKDVPLR